MNIPSLKQVVCFVAAALAQLATIAAMCWLFGAFTGWLSVFLLLLISLMSAAATYRWAEDTGYDMAIAGATKAAGWLAGLRAKVAA